MVKHIYWRWLLCLTMAGTSSSGFAQQGQVLPLIMNITRGGPATPGNIGYLSLAEAHLAAAAISVDRALLEGASLSAVHSHIRDVIRAIDPSSSKSSHGPMTEGAKTGLLHSVAATNANIAVARGLPAASANVKNQGKRVIEASDNVIDWCQHLLELGELATQTTSIEDAKEATGRMRRQLRDIRDGKDADANGRITWRKGEAGLAQLRKQVETLAKGEGLNPGQFGPAH